MNIESIGNANRYYFLNQKITDKGEKMFKLPKVNKTDKQNPYGLKSIQKIIAGIAISVGVAFGAVEANATQVSTVSIQQQYVNLNSGALLLSTSSHSPIVVAGHYSHSSHSSHYSHSSHHSHYSSRY
ncbi:hypothetical protein [Oxalobacter formigenes]